RDDIPFHYALADAFTVCDHYHSSIMGPTWPNRPYWMTGTIDAAGRHGGPVIHNQVPADGLRWTTYAERLQAGGVSWRVYQEADNFGANMLTNFRRFRDAGHSSPLYRRGLP